MLCGSSSWLSICLTNMAARKPNPCIVKWILFTWYVNTPPFGRAIKQFCTLRWYQPVGSILNPRHRPPWEHVLFMWDWASLWGVGQIHHTVLSSSVWTPYYTPAHARVERDRKCFPGQQHGNRCSASLATRMFSLLWIKQIVYRIAEAVWVLIRLIFKRLLSQCHFMYLRS